MTPTQNLAHKPSVGRERLQGIALCVIGSALALAMTAAAWDNAATFLHPGELIDGDRFAGTLEQGRYALALFVAVAVTGLAFVVIGVHQLSTGRRARRLRWLAALSMGLAVAMAWQLRSLL